MIYDFDFHANFSNHFQSDFFFFAPSARQTILSQCKGNLTGKGSVISACAVCLEVKLVPCKAVANEWVTGSRACQLVQEIDRCKDCFIVRILCVLVWITMQVQNKKGCVLFSLSGLKKHTTSVHFDLDISQPIMGKGKTDKQLLSY